MYRAACRCCGSLTMKLSRREAHPLRPHLRGRRRRTYRLRGQRDLLRARRRRLAHDAPGEPLRRRERGDRARAAALRPEDGAADAREIISLRACESRGCPAERLTMERLLPSNRRCSRRRRPGEARRGDAGGRARRAREERGHPARGGAVLGVPVLVSEQYPKGLGPTVPSIARSSPTRGVVPFPKMCFDACSELAISRALTDAARAQRRRRRDGDARLRLPDGARAREARLRDLRGRRRGRVADARRTGASGSRSASARAPSSR